jgi:hypothetical protein
MGHQSVDTTRIYNHSNVTLIREAIERRNQQMSETGAVGGHKIGHSPGMRLCSETA